MGLFDGFEAGFNSFKNNELKKASDWAVSLVPDAQKKEIANWVKENPEKAKKAVKKPFDTAVEQVYRLKAGKANISPVLDNATTDFILSDGPSNPVIPIGDTGPTVKDEVVPAVIDGGEKVTETVKETVTNVTKGIGEALPILAIGAAAVLGVSLLLGRR